MIDRLRKIARTVVDATITPAATYIPSGWRNLVTGLGGATDPMSYHVPQAPTILDNEMLQNLYDGYSFATRIVSADPKEAFRKGFFVCYRGDNEREHNLVSKVSEQAKKIRLAQRSYEGALLGRLHGGSGLLANTTNEDLETPFPLGQEIYSLVVLDAREISPERFYDPISDQANTRFCDHGVYDANLIVGSTYQTLKIHPSRISVFGGVLTPRRDRWEKYRGWDSSILQQSWEALRMLSNDTMSKTAMMRDSSMGILKINKLWDLLSRGYQDQLQTRMDIGHYARSSSRIMPIDSEEEFQWVERAFSGIKDLIEIDMYIVASAAEMPVTVLFGRSPAGQNSTGEHDQKNWHSIVGSSQRNQYSPAIEEIVRRIAASVGANDLENWGIDWLPLEVLSSKEEVELEKMIAETDILRVQMGIDEGGIIKHRYGQGEYRRDPPNFDPELIEEWIASADRWNLEQALQGEDDEAQMASDD